MQLGFLLGMVPIVGALLGYTLVEHAPPDLLAVIGAVTVCVVTTCGLSLIVFLAMAGAWLIRRPEPGGLE